MEKQQNKKENVESKVTNTMTNANKNRSMFNIIALIKNISF